MTYQPAGRYFYPRSPCGERPQTAKNTSIAGHFYPRSPCGERRYCSRHPTPRWHFYPRSPCGERPTKSDQGANSQPFLSTLSLRRATNKSPQSWQRLQFLSTLSLRRATVIASPTPWAKFISIHALLAESDLAISWTRSAAGYFYPRSPCGERRRLHGHRHRSSTISIHALLAESDVRSFLAPFFIKEFLSTLSLRRATAKVHKTVGHFCAYETNFMGIASSC